MSNTKYSVFVKMTNKIEADTFQAAADELTGGDVAAFLKSCGAKIINEAMQSYVDAVDDSKPKQGE